MYIYKVKFRTSEPLESLEDAGPLFRTVVGIVNPLGNSLLGRKPLAAEELDLDLDTHQKVRKFKDEEELLAFAKYLNEALMKEADAELRPKVRARLGSDGTVERFFYETANKRARILLYKDEDGWCIAGFGDFKSPNVVVRALRSNGLDCVARGATWKAVA